MINLYPRNYRLFGEYWIPLFERLKDKNIIPSNIFNPTKTFFKLIKLYEESHRHYHNAQHILTLLDEHEDIQNKNEYQLNYKDELELAIFFHDCVYKTNKRKYKDNEVNSSMVCLNFMEELGITKHSFINTVCTFINCTNEDFFNNYFSLPYNNPNFVNDVKYLYDLDRQILGAYDYNIFLFYSNKIKQEFPFFIRTFTFDKKRKEFLNNLLMNRPIFKTEYFRNKYEDNAIVNINKYLETK
ncbi:MAG: hypothetical protein ACOC2W_01225 [bacterium]